MSPKRKTPDYKRADDLFGKIIRSPGFCVTCGGTDYIQCAHGISRSYRSVRWDWRTPNGFAQCRSCHMKFTHRPLEWDAWLMETWGEELFWEMRHRAQTEPNPDLKEVLADLNARWNDLKVWV